MKQIIIYVLIAIVGLCVGINWPHADLTRCQRAVIEAQAQGLQGEAFNLFVGRDNGCVLRVENGEWSEE